MQDKIMNKCQSFIKDQDVDFIDLRYEIVKDTGIKFESSTIKDVNSNTTDGYVVRVLNNGGLGITMVSKPEDIPWAISRAKEAAEVISDTASMSFADGPVIKDSVPVKLKIDPRDVSLEDKLELTRKYNNVMLEQPEISSNNTIGKIDTLW